MAVAQVVNADALDVRGLAPAVHLVVEVGLREPEYALVGIEALQADVVLKLLGHEVRHRHRAHGFRCLGRGDDVLALDALVALGDLQQLRREVEVRGRERERLALSDAAPVQKLEYGE